MKHILSYVVLAAFFVGPHAAGAELRGTVINGTSKKPSIGDEVVLLTFSGDGMSEAARSKTDVAGRFRFPGVEEGAEHLVRVVHQGVTYHSKVINAGTTLRIDVYDVAKGIDGITALLDVERFEATADVLEVKQLVTMRNSSKPPRTLMNDRTYELQLPPEAQIQSGLVQFENGQPLKQKPVPGEKKGHYYFPYPIRPGDTRFAVIYRLPYSGEAVFEPQIRNPQQRVVVMLPKSMSFEPVGANVFRPMPDTTPDNVQGTGLLSPNQNVAFRISGTGTLEELKGRRKQNQESAVTQSARPGGGLAPPINAPDPLHESRWWILAGFTMLLGIGAVRSMNRAPRFPSAKRPLSVQRRIRDPIAHKPNSGGALR